MAKQLTKQDIFEVVTEVVKKTNQNVLKLTRLVKKTTSENQEIFGSIKQSFSEIEERMSGIEQKMDNFVTKDELKAELKNEFAKFETRMVTKDYLDQKLSDMRGELIEPVKKCEKRLISTLDLLVVKKVTTREEANKVLV
jgi:uncharacterized phage infection (PIP) family protein YhgE